MKVYGNDAKIQNWNKIVPATTWFLSHFLLIETILIFVVVDDSCTQVVEKNIVRSYHYKEIGIIGRLDHCKKETYMYLKYFIGSDCS